MRFAAGSSINVRDVLTAPSVIGGSIPACLSAQKSPDQVRSSLHTSDALTGCRIGPAMRRLMSRRQRAAVLAVACLVLSGASARAHHSVPGTFDVNKTVVITGTISRIDWINPHVYIYVDVKERDGMTTWKIETLPTLHMRRVALSRADIMEQAKGGDVTVHLYPAIKNPSAGFLLRVTFAEGHFYQLYGNEEEIARASK